MAIQQPQTTDYLNSPDHAISHRVFANDDSAPNQAVVVDSAGNVGIGTTTPEQLLNVYALNTGDGDFDGIRVTGDNDSATARSGIEFYHTFGNDYLFRISSEIGSVGNSPKMYFDTSTGSGGGTITAMTMDITGNVGIGTTTPEARLDMDEVFRVIGDDAPDYPSFGKGIEITYDTNSTELGGTGQSVIWSADRDGSNGLDMSLRGREIAFYTAASGNPIAKMTIKPSGNVGIGTVSPTNLLSLGGGSARVFWMERHTTANTAGNSLTVQAGGATAAATDKAGGDLIIQPGVSTGSGESGVQIKGCVAGASGTADRTLTNAIQVLGDKIGFYNQTPIVRAVLATGAGATVDNVITALQNLGLVKQS